MFFCLFFNRSDCLEKVLATYIVLNKVLPLKLPISGEHVLAQSVSNLYLNFANPDKVSVLLNDIRSIHGPTILEPAEGRRWDSHSRALQLKWTIHCYGQLFW